MMIGNLLGNRYEILEKLGGGGMAVVYKARDNFLNRLVTIKALRSEYASDSDFIRRFRREAQSVACLSHPNIVNIHDVGQEGETHYLVMEYVEGDNLKNFFQNNLSLSQDKIIDIVIQTCEALQHAHEHNIVHRDVKPHNILITKEQRVKLTDFGIAMEASSATLTSTDTIVGSVHYISPEQAKGEKPGPESDIYSLGVVLYELITGKLPFSGDGPVAVAIKHIQEQPALPSEINPNVSKNLERVIMKAMAKEKEQRYASAKIFADELHRVVNLKQTPIIEDDEFATQVLPKKIAASPQVKRPSIQPKASDELGNKKKKIAIMALLIVSLLSGALFAFYQYIDVPEVTMPDVKGKMEAEAITTLTKLGLEENIDRVYNEEIPVGEVISQDVPANTKIKRGRSIGLTVSKGKENVVLPDVRGASISDARITLHNQGFDYTEEEIFSEDVESGKVVDQYPLPGTQSKGTVVKLRVSKGPEPVTQNMPSLLGLTLDSARAKIAALNLVLDDPVQTQQSNNYLQGQVATQTPAAGASVKEGSGVTIVLSDGPGPIRKTTTVNFQVDNDGKSHEVKITVTDIRGEKDVYVATHEPGDEVSKSVDFYGSATIRVYVDGKEKTNETL